MFCRWSADQRIMKILLLFSLLLSASTFAQDPEHSFKMRVSWVKTLKKLMVDIEKKKPYELTETETKLLKNFSLIEVAYAESDSPYNCFYGGWPSVKKGESCQSPVETNSSYDKNACKSSELQCQPLLFGKGHCVQASDKNNLFANCEKKFKNFDHLKNMPREDVQELHEMSTVAGTICKDDSSEVCKEVMKKIQDGLKSIDDAFRVNPKSFLKNELTLIPEKKEGPTRAPVPRDEHTEDCPTGDHSHSVVNSVKRLQEVATSGVDELYDSIKADFQGSPFCDPHSVISNPQEKPSPVATSLLLADLYFVSFMKANKKHPSENLAKLKTKYKLSDETINQATPLLDEVYRTPGQNDHTRTLEARAKAIIVQGFMKDYQHDPNFMKKEIEDELVKKRIFTKNDEGKAECPFVNKDAFLKAFAGRESVLKSHGGSLRNKKQITIVDYSRPSNERRMYVIDLESKKVLHNTWVAHGSGKGEEIDGSDGLGGSPAMSNRPGSNLSSDGFIIATSASQGKMFGPNVILKGIDENNGNMQSRAVILHKWSAPYTGYSAGVQDYISETDSFGPVYDINQKMKTTNYSRASREEAESSLRAIANAVYTPKIMSATQGCLGVPLNNIKHLDHKGRNTDQVQALREDLPGSLIFSYSGPEMSSKFF